jgi:hypothetical protein
MAHTPSQLTVNLGLQLPYSSSGTPRPPSSVTGIVVFSGGSAANNLVDVFESVREANQCTLSYVIPISDNGGSSSEIIRVFGGPGQFLLPRGSSLPSPSPSLSSNRTANKVSEMLDLVSFA